MELLDAKLRLKELTQELYNIGDEVAEYIEHIDEAIADWDGELVEECLIEFDEIVADGIADGRVVVSELRGIRQALVSGLRSGHLGVWSPQAVTPKLARPQLIDAASLTCAAPLSPPIAVPEVARAMNARSQHARDQLAAIVNWELEQIDCAAQDLESVSVSSMLSRCRRLVHAVANGWLTTVAYEHPAYAIASRGNNPPPFLAERVWIDSVVRRVQHARNAARATAEAMGS